VLDIATGNFDFFDDKKEVDYAFVSVPFLGEVDGRGLLEEKIGGLVLGSVEKKVWGLVEENRHYFVKTSRTSLAVLAQEWNALVREAFSKRVWGRNCNWSVGRRVECIGRGWLAQGVVVVGGFGAGMECVGRGWWRKSGMRW
jgi:hypothetical protein